MIHVKLFFFQRKINKFAAHFEDLVSSFCTSGKLEVWFYGTCMVLESSVEYYNPLRDTPGGKLDEETCSRVYVW